MILKVLSWILVLLVLLTAGWYVYNLMPGEPQGLNFVSQLGEIGADIDYGVTPVFMENLRFEDEEVTYWIQDSCSLTRQERMNRAFEEIENEMPFLSFSQVAEDAAEILVGCSENFIETGDRSFIAGEGGPTEVINTTLFNLIVEGKILLYDEIDCEYPIVEVHELLHVFGFNHINNPKSLMYNFTDCDQRITPDMVSTLENIYSYDSLPELEISDISALKKGRYLDFEIFVINSGLVEAKEISLGIYYDEGLVEQFDLENILPGVQKSLKVDNLNMGSRGFEEVEFRVDFENGVEELFEDNNDVVLGV